MNRPPSTVAPPDVIAGEYPPVPLADAVSPTDDERVHASDHLAFVAWPTLILALIFATSYVFPYGDQFDHLVILRRLVDPGYLPQDWYAEAAHRSAVRLPYTSLLALPTMLVGEAATFAVLVAVTDVTIAYLIALTLVLAGAPRVVALGASLGTLIVPPSLSSLGASQIIAIGAMTQADLAWLLAFVSLVLGLTRRRDSMAPLLAAAAATLFNPTIGLLAFGANAMFAIQRGCWRDRAAVARYSLGAALVVAWPIFVMMQSPGESSIPAAVQVFNFPLHWLVSSHTPFVFSVPFLGAELVVPRLILVAMHVAMVVGAASLGRRFSPLLYWALGLAGLAALVSAIAAEVGRPSLLINLQGLRLTVILQPIALAGVGWIVWDFVRTTPLHGVARFMMSPMASAVLLVIAIPIMVFGLATPDRAYSARDEALRDAVVARTPEDAVLLAPPDLIWFRIETNRATVVDWKAWPFRPDDAAEWSERIEAVAPGFDGVSPNPQHFHQHAYDAQSPADLVQAAVRYGASHAVTRTQDLSCAGGIEVASVEDRYRVFAAPAGGWVLDGCLAR